jgi:hypothetical protein
METCSTVKRNEINDSFLTSMKYQNYSNKIIFIVPASSECWDVGSELENLLGFWPTESLHVLDVISIGIRRFCCFICFEWRSFSFYSLHYGQEELVSHDQSLYVLICKTLFRDESETCSCLEIPEIPIISWTRLRCNWQQRNYKSFVNLSSSNQGPLMYEPHVLVMSQIWVTPGWKVKGHSVNVFLTAVM